MRSPLAVAAVCLFRLACLSTQGRSWVLQEAEPDVRFGCFSAFYGPSSDPKAPPENGGSLLSRPPCGLALVRVDTGEGLLHSPLSSHSFPHANSEPRPPRMPSLLQPLCAMVSGGALHT